MNHSVASLPWYDFPEIRAATDAFWQALSTEFRRLGIREVPTELNRTVAYERQWSSDGFLFGQACGYDVRISYPEHLQIVATPCYDVPGCTNSQYSSFVIVREDCPCSDIRELRGARCVINTPTSHSGMNVLRALVAPLHSDGRFFSSIRLSGSHARSLQMIERGEVDVAAIDCVTYALLQHNRPQELERLRVLHRTQSVPAPPYVTAASTSQDTLAALRAGLSRVATAPSTRSARRSMFLTKVEVLSQEDYGSIERVASVAAEHNYEEFPAGSLVSSQL